MYPAFSFPHQLLLSALTASTAISLNHNHHLHFTPKNHTPIRRHLPHPASCRPLLHVPTYSQTSAPTSVSNTTTPQLDRIYICSPTPAHHPSPTPLSSPHHPHLKYHTLNPSIYTNCCEKTITYDHRTLRTDLPCRSARFHVTICGNSCI